MSRPLIKVLVVGMGGIGTLAALTLAQNGKVDLSVVIRSQDEEFQNQGFAIDSVIHGKFNWKPQTIYASVEQAAKADKFDYVVVCTKNLPDSNFPVVDVILPAITEHTTIVLNQNGLNIEDPILAKFPNNLILSGIELVGSSKYGNKILNVSIDEIHLGIFKKCKTPQEIAHTKLMAYIDAYRNDKNLVIVDDNVELTRWYKLCYNSVFNTICAISDSDVTRVHINDGNVMFRKVINEIVNIAKSEGYDLQPQQINHIFHKSDGLFYHPSMQIDKEKNQLMEIEVIVGNPLRIAQKNKIDTPNLSLIYDFLKIIQFNIKEKSGYFKINEQDFKGVDSDIAPDVFRKIYHQ